MSTPLRLSASPVRLPASSDPTGTLKPESHGAESLTARQGRELLELERDDLDAVEHVRQNRLKRWQTPPAPTRRDKEIH